MAGSRSDIGLPEEDSSDTTGQQDHLARSRGREQEENVLEGRVLEGSLSVLLVEDTDEIVRRFEEGLRESAVDATLRHEESLDTGLQALRANRPDVLVVDLELSGHERPEGLNALAWAAPEVPFVALAGADECQVALQAQRAGPTEHLQKDELSPALVGQMLHWALENTQKQAKRQQRDAWVRSIPEGLSAGIFRAGPTGRIKYANDALAEMLGFEAVGEVIGRDLTTFCADPVQGGRMLAEEGASDVEVELEGHDGATRVGLLSATATYDASGTPVRYDGTLVDITEKARRKRSMRMLSQAVGQAKEAVLITEATPLDAPGPRVVYVNEAFEEMAGWAKEEILGKTPRVLQGPETDRDRLDSLREALEAGEKWEGETINYRKDGEPYRVQWNVAPVRDEEGAIEYWVSVQRDVTDEREREEQLRLQARALDQIEDKVFITDPEGTIRYVNEAFERITGYAEEDVLGETPRLLQSGEQSEAFYEELWATIRAGETFRADLVNERKDGTRYVEDEQISTVVNDEGEITHFVSTGRDITEQKKAEQELQERTRFYEEVLAQVPIDLAVFSPEAEFEYVNPSGVTDPERREWLIGRTNEAYCRTRGFAPAVGRRRDEAIRRAAKKKTQTKIEETLETEQGPRHYLRVHGPVTNTKGEVTHVVAFGLEVTEQKEQRRRLERYREYTDHLLNASEDLFFVVNANGRLERWNEQVASVTGYSEEELSGMSVLAFFPEAKQARARDAIEEVFATGRSKVETLLLTSDGEEIPYEFTGNRAEHPDGGVRLVGIGRDVAERKRQEERLREQDRRLEQIRKNVTDVVWMSPADKSEIEFISEAYEDIWGRPLREVREAPGSVVEAIHPADRERVRSAIQVQKTRPEAYEETYRVVQPNGDIRWVRDRAAGVYGEEGDLERIIGVATDITEKKRHELRLETINTRLQLALESTNTGTFDWDIETDTVIWDKTSERLFGYAPGGFPERFADWAARVHPADLREAERAIEQALDTGETYDVEFRVRPPDGAERWIRARGEVQYDEEGHPTRMVGIHTDVTERKRREKALRAERDLLDRLLQTSPAAVVVLDSEGQFVRANRRAEEVLGIGPEEVTERAFNDPEWRIEAPDGGPIPEEELPFAKVISTGTPVEDIEHAIEWPDGTRRILSVSGAPLPGPEGAMEGAVFHLSDVTEQKQREQELVEAKEQAEEGARLKTALLANMSHEIRTPLTSIIGFAELLEDEVEGQTVEFADRIRQSGTRLMKTLDSVLELSRLEAGASDFSREEVSLRDVAQDTIALLRPSAADKSIVLEADLPEGPATGYWNEGALNRILENLLGNAIKFTPDGGRVDVRVEVKDRAVILVVEDTGVGISEEAQSEIFTAFKQESEGMAREFEGAGLGLSIVRRLAEAHGGSVEVESQKGKGSRFIVRLPSEGENGRKES